MARRSKLPVPEADFSEFSILAAMKENLIGRKLLELRRSRGLSLTDLCRELRTYGIDVKIGAVSKWELGATAPNSYQLVALCHFYDVSDPVAYFTGHQSLNSEGLRKLADYRADLIATGKYAPEPSSPDIIYITMPVSLLGASAGTGNFPDDACFEQVSVPKNAVPEGADFGIRVCGDSMEPVYTNGQTVWVKQCSTLRKGEVGIFSYDGEGYIKLYREQQPVDTDAYTDSEGILHSQPVLISYNPKYSPIVVSPEKDFRIVGRVL